MSRPAVGEIFDKSALHLKVCRGTNSDTEMVRVPRFMMGRTMTSFWYVISGGVQSEDTFYLWVATSNIMVVFSIRGSEFSLLYVLRWTFRT